MKSTSIVLLFYIFCHTIVNGAHHYYSSNSEAVQDSYEQDHRDRPYNYYFLKKRPSTRKQEMDTGPLGENSNQEANDDRNEGNERENETIEKEIEVNIQENEENIHENEESNQEKEFEQENKFIEQVTGSEENEDVGKDDEVQLGHKEYISLQNIVKQMSKKQVIKGPHEYKYELKNGDMADLFATNQHKYVPKLYTDFGDKFRRDVQQNKDSKKWPSNVDAEAEASLDQAVKDSLKDVEGSNYLVPRKASPELVLSIAKKAKLLAAARPNNPADDVVHRDILRSGDYWNGIWKEDIVAPQKILRTNTKSSGRYKELLPELETVNVKIMPGSKLHDLVSMTKEISPKLLYIVNNKE